jgi:hypothetical protein
MRKDFDFRGKAPQTPPIKLLCKMQVRKYFWDMGIVDAMFVESPAYALGNRLVVVTQGLKTEKGCPYGVALLGREGLVWEQLPKALPGKGDFHRPAPVYR